MYILNSILYQNLPLSKAEGLAKFLQTWHCGSVPPRQEIVFRPFHLTLNNITCYIVCNFILCELVCFSYQGKPLYEATGEIALSASCFQWYSEEARRTYGDVVPTHNKKMRLVFVRQPVGVAGLITPVSS